MGIIALPHKAITRNADPKFVCLPNPLIAKGQIPAYNNALGKPIITKYQSDMSVVSPNMFTVPEVVIIKVDKTKFMEAHINRACRWFKYFGIKIIPMKYPINVRDIV